MPTGVSAGVEQVRAGLAALVPADVVGLADAAVRAEILALVAARNRLDAAITDRVATFDARQLAHADGQYNAAMWLVNFAHVSKGAAQATVARGRLLRQLPALADALRAGSISVEHVGKVAELVRHLGGVDKVQPYDAVLAALAADAGPVQVGKACARIAALENPDGAEPDPQTDHANREVILARIGSMTYLRGRLDPESAAVLSTAIDALMQPPTPGDPRNVPQRRADALTDLARLAVTNATLPTVGGERPHIGLLITPELLFGTPNDTDPRDTARSGDAAACDAAGSGDASSGGGGAGGGGAGDDPLAAMGVPPLPDRPWLNWVGEVHPDVARRIACDASVWRLIVDPRSGLPLDVGDKYRLVQWWIRKALWARDRTCRFPGCDRPCEWTDAHHITPWWKQHTTAIDGLVSLCRFHHRLVHEGQWTLRLDHTTGNVHVHYPDGRAYELGPSKPWTSPTQQGPPPGTAAGRRPAAA